MSSKVESQKPKKRVSDRLSMHSKNEEILKESHENAFNLEENDIISNGSKKEPAKMNSLRNKKTIKIDSILQGDQVQTVETKVIEKADENSIGSKAKRRSELKLATNLEDTQEISKSAKDNSNNNTSSIKSNKSVEMSSDTIVNPKTNFEWNIGNLVQARDRKALKEIYYKAKIIALRNNKEVKIHFLGWNSRYDQWYDIHSGDLKPCEEEKIIENSNDTDAKEFEIGARVMAKWKMDENYYPATVKRLVERDKKKYYEIIFYDGVRKLMQRSEVKELTEEVEKLFPDLALTQTENDLAEQEKQDEESRRAEAELLLAIQQPQLILSSDNESLSGIQQNNIKLEKTLCIERDEADAKKIISNKRLEKIKIPELELESDKTIGIVVSEKTKIDKLAQTEIGNHIPVKTGEKLTDDSLETNVIIINDIKSPAQLLPSQLEQEIPLTSAPLCAPSIDESSSFLIPKSPASSILPESNLASSSGTMLDSALSTSISGTSTSNTSAVRKSLRANKRVRSFTDEIVFDSPLPLTHHINMDVSSQSASPIVFPATTNTFSTTNTIASSNSMTFSTSSGSKRKLSLETPSKKGEEFKSAKQKSKSIKPLGETEPTKTPSKKQKKEDDVFLQNSTKSVNNKNSGRKDEVATALIVKKSSKSKISKREQKKLKKLEKKNKKKLLLEKLLESSRQQLKQNQEMIEEEIKRHEQKKSKKKIKKLLRQQQQQQQLKIPQVNNLNMFFPPSFQTQLINPNFFQNLNLQVDLQQSARQQKNSNTSTSSSNMTQSITQSFNSPLSTISKEPIRCNYKDCNKTFRKQHLLDYHLKYHHYVSASTPLDLTSTLIQQQNQYILQQESQKQTYALPHTTPSAQNKRIIKRANRLSTSSSHTSLNKDDENQTEDGLAFNEFDHEIEEEEKDGIDPYEVIHCKCSNHTSEGFMIQCEICMCWQHGDCANIKSSENVPKHYLCWICKDPGNKLRKLKYQSWMNIKQEMKTHAENSSLISKNDPDYLKLRLLNECSRKYYNLNLLMYTLEYQMSLFDNLTKNKVIPQAQETSELRDDIELNEIAWNQIQKLGLNVSYLQSCLNKKFTEFNAKISELEAKYDSEQENLMENFNLEELYEQLTNIIN